METDPQTISAYLIYLSQHAPVGEQGLHNDLALVRVHFIISAVEFTYWMTTKIDVIHVFVYCVCVCVSGCSPADSGALHHHEQSFLQALVQARVRRHTHCPHLHLLHLHLSYEEDQGRRGSLQLGERTEVQNRPALFWK